MIIHRVSPLVVPAGIPVIFTVDVFSSDPISSYAWSFGDGTTTTTNNENVLKTYKNITSYSLNIVITNNASQTVEKNLTITTQSPEDYINSSWNQKNKNLEKSDKTKPKY